MDDYTITFADKTLSTQHAEIPGQLRELLEAHYDVLFSAPSMRKTPFPAHRNRGVTIKVEDPVMSISVHAARSAKAVEILELTVQVREGFQQEDFEAEKGFDCTFCHVKAGSACINTDGRKLTYAGTRKYRRRTHAARREALRVSNGSTAHRAVRKTVPLLSTVFIGGELLEQKQSNAWDKVISGYRDMFGSREVADNLIRGAVKVLERHHPGKIWSHREFQEFACSNISGPHDHPEKFIGRFLVTAYKAHQVSAKEFEGFQRQGLKVYAKHIGMDFAPHPLGGFVAVRGLKEL
jgi:hypothetical protein